MPNQAKEIEAWFSQDVTRALSDGDLLEAFHRQHPSKVFLRTLPRGATVLDVGAGDGGLSVFKKWPSPARKDLRLYAFSMEKGSLFDEYDGYEIGDWNVSRPSFGGMKFDAIVCANFIEHINDPGSLIAWASQALKEDGRLYIEWPTDASRFCPTLPDLAAMGFGCIIGNYYDDPTHRKILPSTRFVSRKLRARGLTIESMGEVRMPILADELLSHYRSSGDLVSLQMAYWLRTGWIQYATARKHQERRGLAGLLRRLRLLVKRPAHHEAFANRMRADPASTDAAE